MPGMSVMRSILLGMAGSPRWKRILTGLPVTRRVVSRFIPGERLEDALSAVEELNQTGYRATLNPLGENVTSERDAREATDTYVQILEAIAERDLDSNVSVKLTMLGLDLGAAIAAANLTRVLEVAGRHGNSVRIDMESSGTVDMTLEIWRRLRRRHPHVGVVIQSYLRRSMDDVERLAREGASVRVVKGAYNEPPEVAFPDKAEVDRNFLRILGRLAEPDARESGATVAVASHDPEMVAGARQLIAERGLDDWEFQMLYGIGRDLQQQLVREGHPVRVYVSYGPAWYPWFMRRLAERPANVLFFVRHVFG